MAGRPRGITARHDDLIVLLVLKKRLHWSDRRIARFFKHSPSTISLWYQATCERMATNKMDSSAKGGGAIRLRYVGDDEQLGRLSGFVNQNPCGGGREKKKYIYDKEDDS